MHNTAGGYQALYSNTAGGQNTAIGDSSMYNNTTGQDNAAFGFWAMIDNQVGSWNAAFGDQSLRANISGSGETAIGWGALINNTAGQNNTAVGLQALYANQTGNDNIAIGNNAGFNVTNSDNIEIGNAGLATDSQLIRIGNNQTQTYVAGIFGATAASGVPVYVNSSGQLGTLTSSARYKQDIQRMTDASDALYALRPVTFKYKSSLDPQGTPQFGLVAEEVEKVAPDLVARDDQGRPYTVRYQAVDAMLLNEFLKEHQKVEDLERRINKLEQLLTAKNGGAQ